MKKLSFIFISFCMVLIAGCNGHSDNGDATTPQIVTSVTFSVLDNQGKAKNSFAKNEVVTLQATVYDEKKVIIANKSVNFTSSIGKLTVDSKLTNSDGIAIVSLTNEQLTLGAGSANASIGEIAGQSIDFEFIDNSVTITPPSISSAMMLDGTSINQFKANQEVQLVSTLLNADGQGIANKVITFTADIGKLSTSTALTNEQGVANVSLTSDGENIGAGVITSSYAISTSATDNTSISSTLNYQILAGDAIIDSNIRLGYFSDVGSFIEGEIEISVTDNKVSAGGTLGLSVDLVDENGSLITTPIPVTFSSNCVKNGSASIDESVLSINGTATSTFEDINCAGKNGTDDVLIASIAVNGITNVATETISIGGEQLGSIEFVSAEPTSIVLKGTGGQNQQETSTLTYRVKSQLGNVLAQQEVAFILSTEVGGITLSRESGVTNSQGLITTQVSAGSVPTAVRVTASAAMDFNGEPITVQSQSDLLSINTGLPEQRSMTIAATTLNPEALNGVTSTITVWMSDNFQNPVPDGTSVNFTTEGGQIEPTCSTVNGNCSVVWESANPRVADHRVTILATALGHETFFDTNGNNSFDDSDGDPIQDKSTTKIDSHGESYIDFNVDSGLGNYSAQASGFIDMSEAWRDDNEDGEYNDGEKFIDFNNDEEFSNADSLFNGPQCTGSKCASNNAKTIHVRKALRLVMASSAAEYRLTNDDNTVVYADSLTGETSAIPDITDGSSQELNFYFADTGTPNQTMPLDTLVDISISAGDIEGVTNYQVSNNNSAGFSHMKFFILNPIGGTPETAVVTFKITTPQGYVTSLTTSLSLL
jgi:hypothetical protein